MAIDAKEDAKLRCSKSLQRERQKLQEQVLAEEPLISAEMARKINQEFEKCCRNHSLIKKLLFKNTQDAKIKTVSTEEIASIPNDTH